MTPPADPINRYLQKHGHLPRATLNCGFRTQLRVEAGPGYFKVSLYRPQIGGLSFHVPRSTMIRLVRWVTPILKLHPYEDFDVEKAMHESFQFERQHAKEQRQFKKTLYRPTKTKRRRRR
jgi:hypothetical protein